MPFQLQTPFYLYLSTTVSQAGFPAGRGNRICVSVGDRELHRARAGSSPSLWLPVELVWCEMETEATDPNSTNLLQPYLQEKSKELPVDLPEQRINTEPHISCAVIHAKGSCLDEGMKRA